MQIFHDSIDGPRSQSQVLGIVLYAVLALISIWATGESLSLTFEFPVWISYAVAVGILGLMAALMNIIKRSFEERNLAPLVICFLVFLIVWFISLGTNTHNFYLKGSLKDIQEKELKSIQTELEGIRTESESLINTAATDLRFKISAAINNYKKEVTNEKNPGHGHKADSLKLMVEKLLPGAQFTIPTGSQWYNSSSNRIKLAELMGGQMTKTMNDKVNSLLVKKDDIDKLLSEKDFEVYNQDIANHLSSFFDKSITENRTLVSKSWQFYNVLVDQVKNILSGNVIPKDQIQIRNKDIPETPGSISLEHISNTNRYVSSKRGFASSEFLFAFLLALGVDLGAFAIFYFMVLKNDE